MDQFWRPILIDTAVFLASLSGILFIYFRMLDARQNAEGRQASQEKYKKRWEGLERRGWHAWFHGAIESILNANLGKLLINYRWLVALVSILLGVYIVANSWDDLFAMLPNIQEGITPKEALSDAMQFVNYYYTPFATLLALSAILGMSLLPRRIWDKFIKDDNIQTVNITVLSVALFFIPMILLVAGLGMFSYGDYLYYYMRLILVNLVFDVLTLIITWRFLKWLQKANNLFSSILLITLDLITAAMLAFGAIYLGLIGSSKSLTLLEVWNILFFKVRDGSSFGIDPYFWIMHTTFIPSLIHLAILFFALMARYLTLPFLKLFQDASVADKPHYATATTFAFIGSIFSAAAALLKWL